MEITSLEALVELIRVLKASDVRYFRDGGLELDFFPPEPPEPVTVPPRLAGTITGESPVTEESKLPPSYRALFPGGAPTLRKTPRGE